MTTETDPRERPEIRTTDDLLTAVRVGLEIATRSDIHESEHRMMGRINERFDAQDRRTSERLDAQDARIGERFDAQDARIGERFDAQDARLDAQGARLDSFEARLHSFEARLNENTAAIREFKTLLEAERRGKDRAIQWLSIGLATVGTLAAILGVAIAVTN